MKHFLWSLAVVALVSCTNSNSNKLPTTPPSEKPVSDECVLIAQISDPKDPKGFPLQLCMYTHTETRGIFAATACVAVLIETQSGVRHPFYGSKGHWGIEGKCDEKKILAKFKDPQTLKTVNPVTDILMKRQHGYRLKIEKDDLYIGEELLKITTPK